ncbi:ArsR family transcriptional regulator [Alicyclobacillus acidoterrestris]|uniref:ArsR family transcriptional regulator n=1 Tax=Alicyclobacillus acidoterrestris TaxID=1450 RepID=UPI0038996314
MPLFGISQPAVSKHMSRLKAAGLVKESRKWMWVFYPLNKTRLADVGMSLNNLPDMTNELNDLKEKGLLVQCDGTVKQ